MHWIQKYTKHPEVNWGRYFRDQNNISEKQILKDFEHDDTEKIKDELILIGNMIKIIQENGGRYEEFFIRYEHLCKDIMDVLEMMDSVIRLPEILQKIILD